MEHPRLLGRVPFYCPNRPPFTEMDRQIRQSVGSISMLGHGAEPVGLWSKMPPGDTQLDSRRPVKTTRGDVHHRRWPRPGLVTTQEGHQPTCSDASRRGVKSDNSMVSQSVGAVHSTRVTSRSPRQVKTKLVALRKSVPVAELPRNLHQTLTDIQTTTRQNDPLWGDDSRPGCQWIGAPMLDP